MSRRTAAWIAWSLWGLIVALLALSLLLLALSLSFSPTQVCASSISWSRRR
jgi:hypothetical protein